MIKLTLSEPSKGQLQSYRSPRLLHTVPNQTLLTQCKFNPQKQECQQLLLHLIRIPIKKLSHGQLPTQHRQTRTLL